MPLNRYGLYCEGSVTYEYRCLILNPITRQNKNTGENVSQSAARIQMMSHQEAFKRLAYNWSPIVILKMFVSIIGYILQTLFIASPVFKERNTSSAICAKFLLHYLKITSHLKCNGVGNAKMAQSRLCESIFLN